jgi:hypothetical protein
MTPWRVLSRTNPLRRELRLLRFLLGGIAITSAILLLVRGFIGPFRLVHNPINAECALAVSLLLVLLTTHEPVESRVASRYAQWQVAVILLAVGAGFWPVLPMPLITDDYFHVGQIARGEAPSPLSCFTHSCGGPQFFRPLGFAIYWMEWELWGSTAMPRHALDLILHAVSSVLFLLLLRRLGIPPPFDVLAALLFAWNGIRPETVAWPAARFDTLALVFSLIAALAILRGGRSGLIVSTLATAAACLSKESAFVLPLLLAPLAAGAKRLLAANGAVAGGIFVWRWWVLKGIGGYMDLNTKAPTVLEFHGLTLVKTFLARIWGVLWIPVNWSTPLEWWMALGLAAGVAGSLALLKARPPRLRFALCLACVAIACVPVHHMLLIGPSLERSRYLTYATVPFILALALAYSALPIRIGIAAMALLLGFHAAALWHNLKIWRSVASARYEMCHNVAARARDTSRPIAIIGLPLIVDGVYWSNGLGECLWLEFDIPPGKVLVNDTAPADALILRWNPDQRSVHE